MTAFPSGSESHYHSPIHHFEQQLIECFLDSPWSSAGLTQKIHDFIA